MLSKIRGRVRVAALSSAALATILNGTAAAQSADEDETVVMDTVEVRGIKLAQQRAIELKRNSDAILDAISADEIGKLPVKNAAEAIDFLPGVSLEIDQGEGRYVTIRGAASSLNNVTLNGVAIGSPEGTNDTGGGRITPLDVVGGELLKGIEVVKAVTPDMDHQTIGGSVNILTFSPFDYDDFFAFGSAAIGYGEYGDKTSYRGSATMGDQFGTNDDWGYLFGVSYSVRDFESVGAFPDDWAPATTDGGVTALGTFIPEQWKSNLYDIERERFAVNAALEHKPNEDSYYYARALWSEFNEDENRIRFAQRIADQNGGLNELDALANGVGTWSGLQRENELRREKKDKRIFNLTAGGENTFDNFDLAYEASLINNEQSEPNSDWEFRDTDTSGTFDANSFLFELTPDASTTFDPDGYRFQRLRFQDYDVETKGYVLSSDLVWNADFLPADSFFKAGFNLRNTEKTQDYEEERYGRDATCTMGEFGLSAGSLPNDVDGTIYELGPVPDGAAVDAFFISNPECFELSQGNTVLDGALEDFSIEEEVLAGYVMANIELTDRLTMIAGVRIEDTSVDSSSFQVDPELNVTPTSFEGGYTDVMPSLHLRYDLTDNTLVRFAYTNTIGRPDLDDIVPARELEFEEETDAGGVGLGTFVGGFSTGNPDLEAFESTNFDLSIEHYLPNNLGIISAAVFHKEVDGFIINESVQLAGGTEGLPPIEFEGQTYTNLSFSRPINADEGTITGLELGYQQQFDFLPGLFGNLGVGASYTFVDSEIQIDGRDLPFPRQSDDLFSLQAYYQDETIEAVLTYNYNSEYFDSSGGSDELDIFYNERERLDFKGRYKFNDRFGAFAEWQNILDEPDWEYQGVPDRVTGYELYGQTVFVGIDFKY